MSQEIKHFLRVYAKSRCYLNSAYLQFFVKFYYHYDLFKKLFIEWKHNNDLIKKTF